MLLIGRVFDTQDVNLPELYGYIRILCCLWLWDNCWIQTFISTVL